MSSKNLEKCESKKKQKKETSEKNILIRNALKEIPNKVIYLEEARQVSIRGYQMFIGEIDFQDDIKENYNIYYKGNSKVNRFKIVPYGLFYDEMYVLENKINKFRICLFFRFELENIYYKKIPLIKLYKQKRVRMGICNLLEDSKCSYSVQIVKANFRETNSYFASNKIIKICLNKSIDYINKVYLKNKIVVEEFCEENKYIEKKSDTEICNNIEDYFKEIFIKKAYNEIKTSKAAIYTKKIEIEGATISAVASKIKGKKHCRIYLIMENVSYYFAYYDVESDIVNIDFEINAPDYKTHETVILYDNQTYNTTFEKVFKEVCIEDLA